MLIENSLTSLSLVSFNDFRKIRFNHINKATKQQNLFEFDLRYFEDSDEFNIPRSGHYLF